MKKLAVGAAAAVILLAIAIQILHVPGTSPETAPGGSDPSLTTAASSETAVGTEVNTGPDRAQIVLDTAPTLTLEVVDAAGVPVPGARAWSWVDAGTGVDQGDTDAAGRVILTGAPQPGHVLVQVEGRWPESREFHELLGHHEVVLPPREVLQGWIRVDGEVPRDPIDLQVIGDRPPIPEGVPEELLAKLKELALDEPMVTTRPDGSFHLNGLPATWSGRLVLQNLGIHWFRHASPIEPTDQRTLTLPGPRTGLQLELTELPIVQGRVVWSHTGLAVEGASVMVVPSFSGNERGFGTSTGPDGNFRVGIFFGSSWFVWADPEQREEFDSVSIEVRHDAALEPRFVELATAELGPRGSVGTIALDPRPLVHFLVVDRESQPIPGALIRGGNLSEPTDKDGRGEVYRTDEPYTVGALGYTIEDQAPITGSGEVGDPFVFVLEPGNVLTIRLRDRQGGIPAVERVQILVRESLFTGGRGLHPGQDGWWVTPVHRALINSMSGGGSRDEVYLSLEVGNDGRFVLPSLVPDAKFTLRIYGRLYDVAVSEEVVAPGLNGEREIEILVPEPFRISGQVLDEHGAPILNATVRIRPPRSPDGSIYMSGGPARTGEDGSFVFDPIFAELTGASLEVAHRGHAALLREDLRLGPDTGPLILRLEKGHDLDVKIVDPTGHLVPVDRVRVEGVPESEDWGGAASVWGNRVEPGVFRYEDFPPGTAVFWCEVAGKRYEISHEVRAGLGVARIQVPEVGWLSVFAPEGIERRRHIARITAHPRGLELEEQVSSLTKRSTREILLPPGAYDVVLEEVRSEQGVEVGRRVVGGPVRITVRVRELTECKLN